MDCNDFNSDNFKLKQLLEIKDSLSNHGCLNDENITVSLNFDWKYLWLLNLRIFTHSDKYLQIYFEYFVEM